MTSTTANGKAKKMTKVVKPPQGNRWRPMTVTITANLPKDGGRRVTSSDLEKAGAAAAAAYRAALEGRTPAYEILDLTVRVRYDYVQVDSVQKL